MNQKTLKQGVILSLMFANDICVFCPSVRWLQRILDVCQAYAESHGIIFNCSKTVCMTFKYTPNKYGLSTPPCLSPLDTWNGSDKCLAHFICFVCTNVSLYQCFSKRTKHIGIFIWISFSNNFTFNTRSNAFEASKKTASTYGPWVRKYEAVCFKKNAHWSILCPGFKTKFIVCGSKVKRAGR